MYNIFYNKKKFTKIMGENMSLNFSFYIKQATNKNAKYMLIATMKLIGKNQVGV